MSNRIFIKWLIFRNAYRHHIFIFLILIPLVIILIYFYLISNLEDIVAIYLALNLILLSDIRAFLFDEAFSTASSIWTVSKEHLKSKARYIFAAISIAFFVSLQIYAICFIYYELSPR